MKLLIADSPKLELPLDAVTQKNAFLGRTGSGKTYAAMKLAEEMFAAMAQIVVLDPVGVWYGLRIAADGKSPGLSIPVFGGLNGDVPIEVGAGAYMANLIVDHGTSAILDVSQFEHDTHKAKFAGDFAARFFFRKKASPSAVHVFLEECQEFIPENPGSAETDMLHNFNRMWKLGRNFGIGGSLISQRPQEINKKSLNLTELMFAFQMTGPHERKTMKQWMENKDIEEDIVAILPKLTKGCAHIWSPSWLQISETFHIAKRNMFDASKTPEVGKVHKARIMAPINIDKIRADMKDTIERAKAEDPVELKKRIADLEKQLRAKSVAVPEKIDPEKVKKMVEREVKQVIAKTIRPAVYGWFDETGDSIAGAISGAISGARKNLLEILSKETEVKELTYDEVVNAPYRRQAAIEKAATGDTVINPNVDAQVGGTPRKLLGYLAWYGKPIKKRFLANLAGIKSSTGTFRTYLSTLSSAGLARSSGEFVQITPEGKAYVGTDIVEPPQTTREVMDLWSSRLGGTPYKMLEILVSAEGQAMFKSRIGVELGISHETGTFRTYLSELSSAELIVKVDKDRVAANKESLFL